MRLVDDVSGGETMAQDGPRSALGTWVLVGYVVVGIVTTGCYLSTSLAVRSAITVVAGLLAVAAVLVSCWVNTISDRLPWLLVLAGMVQLTAVNVTWLILVGLRGAATGDTPATIALQLGGYMSVLAASVVVVLRHTSDNAGGVVDSALTGLGIAAPIWEFLMRPRLLAADLPAGPQLVILAQLLALLAVLGSLLRVFRTSGRGMAALLFLFLASAWTVAGSVVSAFAIDVDAARRTPVIGACWVLAYLSLTAGALHPTAGYLTCPVEGWRERPPRAHLVRLGFFLVVIPLVGGVPQIFGREPDGLLLSLGPLLATPLVLTRIGLLIAQRAKDQHDLAYQATHDELTGLPNRRQLFTLVAEACNRCSTGELDSLAVLYCDLDGFKPVNDRYGHEAGDEVLRVVGRRLTASVRADDTVGRLGGDEFLVLCPGARRSEAESLRERVQAAIADPVAWRGGTLRIGITVGVAATSGEDGTGAEDGTKTLLVDALLTAADLDMYARKPAGPARTLAPASIRGAR